MSVINSIPLIAAGDDGYQISRSVRLRSSASAYFNRTFSTGSTTQWTWSAWVKRGTLGTNAYLFSPNNINGEGVYFNSSNQFSIAINGAILLASNAVYRDPSAWYHIVVTSDMGNATASLRCRVYINGVEITSWATDARASYSSWGSFNSAINHNIGVSNANTIYWDGYITESNFVNAQALTPSSFGETDAITGVWKPKKYAGTYGTNGFYLNFSDNSNNTAATIGKDYSGNGNNWTPNNISVTAGATYDSMLDVPTPYADGGNGRGNYAVVNPLSKGSSQTNVIDGNLYAVPASGASNWGTVFSSIAIPTSGKWYVEALANVYTGSGNNSSLGVVDSATFIPTNTAILYQYTTGQGFDGIMCHLFSDYVTPIAHGVQGTNVTGQTASTETLMLAIDVDNGKIYAGYNGTWLNSGNPAGGTGYISSRTFSSTDVVAGHTSWNGANDQSQYYNFGQRPFAYTPPTGFKALNTQNLPDSTIKAGNKYFDATTFDGVTGGGSVVNSGGMQPDLVWMKARSSANNHELADSVRGTAYGLFSNLTNAEVSDTRVSSFNSNGFSYGTNSNSAVTGRTSVGWQWKKGATQGFDIVTYTGTGSATTVAHSLGAVPKMIIAKNRTSGTPGWPVYHASVGNTGALILNQTTATDVSSAYWNNTTPTSSVFSVGTGTSVNTSAQNYVAYLFAEVAGFSKFGSYTGNGSADGPFVYCGFRPRYVLWKCSSSDQGGNAQWGIVDTSRNTSNVSNSRLNANSSGAEDTNPWIDILSNGFKVRETSTSINANGATYIFAAFAEVPFKAALGR